MSQYIEWFVICKICSSHLLAKLSAILTKKFINTRNLWISKRAPLDLSRSFLNQLLYILMFVNNDFVVRTRIFNDTD